MKIHENTKMDKRGNLPVSNKTNLAMVTHRSAKQLVFRETRAAFTCLELT